MDVIFVNDCCFYLNIRLHFKISWPPNKVYTIHEIKKNPKLIKYVLINMVTTT